MCTFPCEVGQKKLSGPHFSTHLGKPNLQGDGRPRVSQTAHNLPTDRLAPTPCHTVLAALPVVLPLSPTQLLLKHRDTPHPSLSPAMPPLGPWYVPSSIFWAILLIFALPVSPHTILHHLCLGCGSLTSLSLHIRLIVSAPFVSFLQFVSRHGLSQLHLVPRFYLLVATSFPCNLTLVSC